ncbi:MAG: RidA family protein [Pseudomonadota bacterium]
MGLASTGWAPQRREDQLNQLWANIRRRLAGAGMTCADIVRVSSYLRDRHLVEANQAARLAALAGRRVPTKAIVLETLQPGWLVEIEVIAVS